MATEPLYGRDELEAMASSEGVVLNLGCGDDDRGIGIDIHYEPDICADLNDGIPVADDAADKLIAFHIIEHLNNPTHFLKEARRVLADDGVLELEVPNVGWPPVRLWLTQDMQRFWAHKTPGERGHWLARRLGNPDDRRTPHRTLWTRALLAEHLDRAGFAYEIDGWHLSRNLHATATPATERQPAGRTLHELERAAGADLASGDYWAQTRARSMRRWIAERQPESILDVGCGSGYLTAELADGSDTRVIGVDTNEQSIEAANMRETAATYRVADGTNLPFADAEFAMVIFGDVIEHFENPEPLLVEARRVLAEQGSMIVSVPAYRFLFGPHDEHNKHHDRFTARRLANVVEPVGFRLCRSRYTNVVPLVPYFVYQRILGKPVPGGARGGHNAAIEAIKRALIRIEADVDWPAGITLLAEFETV